MRFHMAKSTAVVAALVASPEMLKLFVSLCSQLSPENLHQDGERSAKEAARIERGLRKSWDKAAKALGHTVEESHVWEAAEQKKKPTEKQMASRSKAAKAARSAKAAAAAKPEPKPVQVEARPVSKTSAVEEAGALGGLQGKVAKEMYQPQIGKVIDLALVLEVTGQPTLEIPLRGKLVAAAGKFRPEDRKHERFDGALWFHLDEKNVAKHPVVSQCLTTKDTTDGCNFILDCWWPEEVAAKA
jgi:hypothetical protein